MKNKFKGGRLNELVTPKKNNNNEFNINSFYLDLTIENTF